MVLALLQSRWTVFHNPISVMKEDFLLENFLSFAENCKSSTIEHMNQPEITIKGKTFRFVRASRRSNVGVYTSGELYARIGGQQTIQSILTLHKKFESFDFPVPEIVSAGDIGGSAYFLEKSLGEKCFSFLFRDDIEKYGKISSETFEKFLAITEKFARAQIQSKVSDPQLLSTEKLIRPQTLAEELPEFQEKILGRFEKVVSELAELPGVLTHGDFNSHNLFPTGVIDFEHEHYLPFGYDLVTNIFHIKYFPVSRNYEFYQFYSFDEKHTGVYYERLDALFLELGLPLLSKFREAFEYCRAVWLTENNHSAPKFQQWRYELFKTEYLL